MMHLVFEYLVMALLLLGVIGQIVAVDVPQPVLTRDRAVIYASVYMFLLIGLLVTR